MKTPTHTAGPADTAAHDEAARPQGGILARLPFDPLRALDAVVRRWKLCLVAGIVCAAAAFAAGVMRFRAEYGATVQLIRQEPPNAFRATETGEAFKPRTLSPQTIISLARSPAVVRQVSAATGGTLPASALLKGLTVATEKNTDLLRLEFVTAASAQKAADVLNAFASQVVQLTREMQTEEAATVNRFLKNQIANADAEIAAIERELLDYGREARLLNADKEMDAYLRQLGELNLKYESTRIDGETIGLKIAAAEAELAKHSPAAGKLQAARDELAGMLSRYTEQNPMVIEQRAKITALEADSAVEQKPGTAFPKPGGNPVADSLFLELLSLRSQQQVLTEQVRQLGKMRDGISTRLSSLPEKEMHSGRIKARQRATENAREMLAARQREAELFERNALGYYRIITPATAENTTTYSRAKKLMLVVCAALFSGLAAAAAWSVRRGACDGVIRTALDMRRATNLEILASRPADLTRLSQQEKWAFRTWTTLRQRLVTVEDGIVCGWLAPKPGVAARWLELFGDAASQRGQRVVIVGALADAPHTLGEAITSPETIAASGEGRAPVRIEIPESWAWTAENRRQWRNALQFWRSRDFVVLVEITAPGEPESVLFAETLPHIICLAADDACTVRAFADIVAPYREAGCPLLGAAIDGAPQMRPRWIAGKLSPLLAGTAALMLLAGTSPADEIPRARPVAFPGAQKAAAPWLERLTLGPGDSVNITIYRQPELERRDVFVGPDGKITYLQAQGVQAAGLTIDELRERLNTELARYFHAPRVIVTPVAFRSKRVFVLGKVVDKGAVILDRPMSILDAVASAHGLEVGLYQQNTVELADLPHSMLVRRGHRLPVDFERLFLHGDLSQNLQLEPDDYLCFPSASSNEFHVFGAVKNPGTQGLTPQTTVASALTVAGGFSPKAWRKRVLVVRGSLSKPTPIVVDLDAILSARAKDVRLEPRDIVFVADHPWAKVEELLDLAITSFTQAAVTTWTGGNVGPIITRQILPNL